MNPFVSFARRTACALFLGGALAAPSVARAAPSESFSEPGWDPGRRVTSTLPNEVRPSDELGASDGIYGRFDGSFDLGVDVGAEVDGAGAGGAAQVSLHYLYMAGIYGSYADALGGEGVQSSRIVSFGVDLRPLFIARWTKNMERGPALLDLALDTISIGFGAYFRKPPGEDFADRRGIELSGGFGVPLAGSADGPWLGARGLLRWEDDGAAPPVRAAGLFTLGWHVLFGP
jgi:hypothetical protein